MSIKIISYDLGQPETSDDYEELINYIKKLGDWAKPLESFWFVKTNKTCRYIRDNAKQHLDSNDRIFVAKWNVEDWAGLRIRNKAGNWLNNLD